MMTHRAKKFPSPCGEKVGINWLFSLSCHSLYRLLFPSPCGEKVGINLQIHSAGKWYPNPVSVPLRGKGRDQQKAIYWTALFQRLTCFRPLAGKR